MSRRYTAQDMREMALVEESYGWDVVAKMLRQAADDMEREKKYEYATVLPDGSVSCAHDDVMEAGHHAFRRSVGEWEEVRGEE